MLILPINYITSFCEKINIKPKTAILLSIILFFVGVMSAPTSENSSNDLNQTPKVEGESNEAGSNEEKDEKPEPHKHTEEILPAKDATCTEKGSTEGKKCLVCGEVLVSLTEIAAKGHSYKDGKCIICDADDPDYKPEVEEDNKEDSNDSTNNTPTNVENQKYIVTFTSRIIEKNSVGSDWIKGIKYENVSIRSGDTIENKMQNTLYLMAFAIEQDDSGDDYGSITIEFSKIGIGEKTSQTVIVKVAEDKGRYKGNIAEVEFIITIERIS